MMCELKFDIAGDDKAYDDTLRLCRQMGCEVLVANRNGSPDGHHEFKVEAACDTDTDFANVCRVMLHYLDR